ncbi:carboxymuconolactone decarboxylase family protein [Streptomyces sp. NPDC059009]|uniref:carboxymuconolactone decarboxylase family protein n=1 Tax=Streptomyces sp. NPDC059009 TaxID=3346694 RepID=UPI00368FFCE1
MASEKRETPATPRIPPQPPQEWAEELRETLTADVSGLGLGLATLGEARIFSTLARHPELFQVWLPFGVKLTGGELPAADRELLILRAAHNCASPYEWGHHARTAERVGLSAAEIARIADGPDAPGWSERQALLLRAADELHTAARISEGTWRGLAQLLTEQQLIELPMLVGHYHLIAFTLNSLGVQPEEGLPPLPPA